MNYVEKTRDIILALLKSKNVSSSKMLAELGYNVSLITDMKRGSMPSSDKLGKIAKYLGVSINHLLGDNTYSLTFMEACVLRDLYEKSKQENKIPDQVFYISLLQHYGRNTEQFIQALKGLKFKGYIEIVTDDFSNSPDNRNDLYLTEKGIELLKSYGYYY